MTDIWFISDTHFGHSNILNFKDNDGNPLRPFNSVEEMDMVMIENWNKVVKQQDKIYHLGDITFNQKKMEYFKILNGYKRLVAGNHDTLKLKKYTDHFQAIYGVRVFQDFVCTHIPIHPASMARFKYNVHGHTHSNNIDDDRYINICVEKTNYAPIHIDEIRKIIKSRE